MNDNVGHALSQHASGLGSAVNSLMMDAIVNDDHSKDLARVRRQNSFKLPSFEVEQDFEFTDPSSQQPQKVNVHIKVPGCMCEDGTPLIIKKYRIASKFEAMIRKHHEVNTETDVHGKVKSGFLGIPKISFDIAEKVHTTDSADETQHNTFDIEIEMGQGKPPLGYTELVKAFVRTTNKVVDYVCHISLQSPKASEDGGFGNGDSDGEFDDNPDANSGDNPDATSDGFEATDTE